MPRIGEVSITLNAEGMEAYLRRDLQTYITARMEAFAQRALPKVREYVATSLLTSRHHISLMTGTLREQFGIVSPGPLLAAIATALQASVSATVIRPVGDNLGGVEFGAFRADFADAMNSGAATYRTSGSRRFPGGVNLPWLQWLLFDGDRVVIPDYDILVAGAAPPTGYAKRKVSRFSASRTGKAVMVKRDYTGRSRHHASQGRTGSGWRVPPEYAGTASRNWLTEAADTAGPFVYDMLEKELGAL